jgi:hypothetical protein
MTGEVKWLYPGAEKDTLGMDSEGTDRSKHGDSENPSSIGADSCSKSAPSSPLEELGVPVDQLSSTVAAASTYVGSLWGGWNSSSSSSKKEKDDNSTGKKDENAEVVEVEDRKRSSLTGGLGMMSSAFGKLSSFSKAAPLEQEEQESEKKSDDKEEKESGGYFSAASLGAGISSLTSSLTMENLYSATGATTSKDQEEKEVKAEKEEGEETEEKEDWSSWSKGAFSKVGQLTSNYSKVLHETVSKAPLIADFNQEQEEFIKSKGGKEQESAPWSGYQGEEELREKILGLSEDRRNFLRAPPQGVDFDFEYSAVAAHAVVLLGEDPRLREMRYELVPKKVKEDEFWRNYFYRVGLAKQSFELAPVAPITSTATAKPTNSNASANRSMDEVEDGGGEQEEEFLSEQQEASSRDLQEADEAMKKLGLAKNDAEWEAELEGELNEYEMVGGEEGEDLNEDQIQALLEAEK